MLLKKILSAMRGGEQVKLIARRMPDGSCEVVVTTIFAEPPKDLAPALLQLRAALCRPIIIRASEDGLDADLQTALDAHDAARAEAVTILQNGIADLEAATKAAKGSDSKGKKKDTPAKAAPKPAVAVTADESAEETPAAAAPTGPDLFADA